MNKPVMRWHVTAHPKGSALWKTAWQYGLFDTEKDATDYINANLLHVDNVEFFAAIGSQMVTQ